MRLGALSNTTAIVLYIQYPLAFGGMQTQINLTFAAADCLIGIDQQIKQYLTELCGIAAQ